VRKTRYSTLALLAALAATTIAIPTTTTNSVTKHQSNVDAVIANIDAWQNDISAVYTFLDIAAAGIARPGTVDFASQANLVLGDPNSGTPNTASDEPTRLNDLTAFLALGDANARAASADLGNIFPGVLGNLSIIVNSGNDVATVQGAVNAINLLRCNEVLPDISELWNGVVLDTPGAPLPPPTAVGPAVCPSPTVAKLPTSGLGSPNVSSI
jgi:hypothetical protein